MLRYVTMLWTIVESGWVCREVYPLSQVCPHMSYIHLVVTMIMWYDSANCLQSIACGHVAYTHMLSGIFLFIFFFCTIPNNPFHPTPSVRYLLTTHHGSDMFQYTHKNRSLQAPWVTTCISRSNANLAHGTTVWNSYTSWAHTMHRISLVTPCFWS